MDISVNVKGVVPIYVFSVLRLEMRQWATLLSPGATETCSKFITSGNNTKTIFSGFKQQFG